MDNGFQSVEEIADYLHRQVKARTEALNRLAESSPFWAVAPQLREELEILRVALQACGDQTAPANEPEA